MKDNGGGGGDDDVGFELFISHIPFPWQHNRNTNGLNKKRMSSG